MAEAALTGQLHADDIVVAGSPGMHADTAQQLMTDPRHVWAGSADDDPVSNPAIAGAVSLLIPAVGPWIALTVIDTHSISPHQAAFGANRYETDTSGHSDYWNAGSISLRNQAAVIVGRYSGVGMRHGQAPPDVS